MSHHILKAWPEYFDAVGDGSKTFEVRRNDRGFKVGDSLELREFEPCPICAGSKRVNDNGDKMACVDCHGTGGDFTGRWIWCRVSYVLEGDQFGIHHGFSVLGLLLPKNHQWPIRSLAEAGKYQPQMNADERRSEGLNHG